MRDKLLSIAERILEKYRGEVSDIAVGVGYSRELMIKIANTQPSVSQYWSQYDIHVYMARNERVVGLEFSTTNRRDIEDNIDRVLRIMDSLKPSPYYAPLPEPAEVRPIDGLVDRRVKRSMGNPAKVMDVLLSRVARVNEVAGMVNLGYYAKALATSSGSELYEESTGVKSYIRAFKGDGSGQWAFGSTRLDFKSLKEMVSKAVNYARESVNPKPVEPGRYDVLFSPMVMGNLLNLVGWMASAMSVDLGMSMFVGKKPGDTVGSDKLVLMDAPRNPELPEATAFDYEGVPTYNKPIIDRGVFKTLLFDSGTARKFGAKTTGNSHGLFPEPWNLEVMPGDYSENELIKEVKRGILITNNWYTRLQNYVEGVFSTVSRDAAFLIENGEIKHPLSRFRIADTMPNLLRNIVAVGKKRYDIHWWEVETPIRLPYMLVKDLNITKPQ